MYSGASGRLHFESDYYKELMMGLVLTTGETGCCRGSVLVLPCGCHMTAQAC